MSYELKNNKYLFLELVVLFVVFPLVTCLSFSFWIKAVIGLLGFVYIIRILRQDKYILFKKDFLPLPKSYIKQVSLVFILLAITTHLFLYNTDPQKLFSVLINKPLLWIIILFVYSLLSVLPQEIIYRSFFFHRYEALFSNKVLLIFINALVFSLCHLFFQNTLVMIITFLGGLVFAYSYLKTKSLTLIVLEHTLYGYWLFTVGMGEMLGFPGG